MKKEKDAKSATGETAATMETPAPEIPQVKTEMEVFQEKMQKIHEIQKLTKRHSYFVETQQNLLEFTFESDRNNDRLTINDSHRREFSTTNTDTIRKVIETLILFCPFPSRVLVVKLSHDRSLPGHQADAQNLSQRRRILVFLLQSEQGNRFQRRDPARQKGPATRRSLNQRGDRGQLQAILPGS